MKIKYILIIYFLVYCVSNAQKPYSLNNVLNFVPTSISAISFIENPNLNNNADTLNLWSFGIAYQPAKMGFDELSNSSINLGYKLNKKINLQLGANYYGFDLFNEFSINLSGLYNFDDFVLGGTFSFNQANVKDFNSESIVTFDLFGKIDLSSDFAIGYLLTNINRAYYSTYSKTIYQNAIFSINYHPIDKFNCEFGGVLTLGHHSSAFISTKFMILKDLINANLRLNSYPIFASIGVSINPFPWFNFVTYINYLDKFGFDRTFLTEFKW
jgi:hypothetical protein